MKRVLLITIDQTRADSLACMGHPAVKTPHMDALAADGVLFRKHYNNAVPCGPSRASLLTGMYPTNHRMITNGTPLDASFTNIALEMRKAGYDPMLFGYTDTTPDPRYLPPDDPSLTTYEGPLPGFTVAQAFPEHSLDWAAYLKRMGYDVTEPGYGIYAPANPDDGKGLSAQPSVFKAEDSETAWLMDKVIDHLEFAGDAPFFVHASFLRPHPPFIAPEPYCDLYRDVTLPKPVGAKTVADERAQHPAIGFFQEYVSLSNFLKGVEDRPLRDLTEEDFQQIKATYLALITEVDHHIGRLVQSLKEKGIYEDTTIILTSDHGEQMGDHGLLGKASIFEKSFHIPLMIKGGRRAARGVQVDHFTEAVDIMPTILDLCGLEIPHQCDGRSLVPFLKGVEADGWRDHACGQIDFRNVITKKAERKFGLRSDQCAALWIRDEHYKYIHFSGLTAILYDLVEDPDETRNLAGDPAYAPVMLKYAQKLLTWRMVHAYGALDGMMVSLGGVVVDPDR
ncbi:alkaline phosphatase family protein [Aestuariispira insulae]|uniref:Arylsulfatase A-like enzyme n=1 Tax=Aestuariispira insulae TaxID=1461337 RepID=A0A3D9H5M8_9PROT|nr:alkaline phosphatase family protein [Aestuariispira insulae]RED44843.1 arylsulfatase A-like enzyme [Aestuariispira insulae]